MNGWTEWIYPVMKGYKMECCDCSLVHDIDFEVVKLTKSRRRGKFAYLDRPMPTGKVQVRMRVRRNNRSTAQVRRHRKK